MSDASQFVSKQEAKRPYYVGVDLGGTNIKAGVVDDLGRPMSWLSVPTETPKGPEDGARRMGQAVLDAIEQAGLQPSDIARVGLGSPGTMDIPKGKLVVPANLKGWEHFPIIVAEEAGKGDQLCKDIVFETARYMGVGISTLMHMIDPGCILLGGAMTFGGNDAELGRSFLQEVKEEVGRRVFAVLAERITIDFAALGGDAGFIGAAGLARVAYRKSPAG